VDENGRRAITLDMADKGPQSRDLDVALVYGGQGHRTYPGRVAANASGKRGTTKWRRPDRRRVLAIRDRLREIYGQPVNEPHGHPIAELVRTILSQNTSDLNRDRAYDRLRERLPKWEQVRDASVEDVIEAIRPGGLANTKGPRIQQVLRELPEEDGEPTLDWLNAAPREEALQFLTALPGVGRKTAACVMIFALGKSEIPVDVHVHRVGGRLGLFRPGASFEEEHDEMLRLVNPEDAYEFHINLITHGRRVCRPKPRCGECDLRRMCPYYREAASAPSA
jgi:endonuclease-3